MLPHATFVPPSTFCRQIKVLLKQDVMHKGILKKTSKWYFTFDDKSLRVIKLSMHYTEILPYRLYFLPTQNMYVLYIFS